MPRFNTTANGLASLGRNGDTMLMHVNPDEVAGLSALLGSEPTINPDTGMPEAFGWVSALGNIMSSLIGTGVGANIAEEVAGSEIAKSLSDWIDPETLGTVAAGVGGAGVGSLIGAATAGMSGDDAGYGALGGAISGGMAGGYGGMEKNALLGIPEPTAAENKMDELFYDPDAPSLQRNMTPQETPGFMETNFGSMAGLKNFVKEHGKIPLMASQAGMGFLAQGDYEDQQERRKRLVQQLGFANGGAIVAREPHAFVGQAAEAGIPITMRIPDRYVEDIQDAGGIESLMKQQLHMAQGGYINTKPFNPNQTHPQGMIDKAQPYAAASPQRHEPMDPGDDFYADGGFIDGEGDGMSDDIDASIDGVEPVKVADGEFIIPKDIVDMLGVDALDDMMKRVRMAAHGSDKQIKQDAAKKAFMQTVMG